MEASKDDPIINTLFGLERKTGGEQIIANNAGYVSYSECETKVNPIFQQQVAAIVDAQRKGAADA